MTEEEFKHLRSLDCLEREGSDDIFVVHQIREYPDGEREIILCCVERISSTDGRGAIEKWKRAK